MCLRLTLESGSRAEEIVSMLLEPWKKCRSFYPPIVLPGFILLRYKVEDILGCGTFGEVHEAVNVDNEKPWALKEDKVA